MKDSTKRDIWDHAESNYPRESCGLILIQKGKEVYFPCANISQNNDQFVISPEDYAKAEETGDIVKIVHRH